MARIAVSTMQKANALNSGWGLYNFKTPWSGSIRYGLPAVRLGRSQYDPDWTPLRGLGASCPEGSRSVGGECVCYDGRVWMPDRSKCVSPQSPAYIQAVGGGSTTHEGQENFNSQQWGQQTLTESARRYIESQGHTIKCKISENWASGPQGGQPAMLCSIDGGPYEHAAYAINQNPAVALISQQREVMVQRVSQASGVAPGALYTTPELIATVDKAMSTGQVNAGEAQAAAKTLELKTQLTNSLVPGVDYDVATGMPLSWRAEVAGSNRVTTDLVMEALNLPPGATLANPAGPGPAAYDPQRWTSGSSTGYGDGPFPAGYQGPGTGTNDPSDPGIGFSASGLPWYVWAGAAAGIYFLTKK